MTTPGNPSEREQQVRRTRSVRRGIVAAGATGALGAAIAIGTTIHTSGSTAPGATDNRAPTYGDDSGRLGDDSGELGDDQAPQTQQAPQSGQLAGPSGGGPAQGHSAGS